jgi:hypothetical protein
MRILLTILSLHNIGRDEKNYILVFEVSDVVRGHSIDRIWSFDRLFEIPYAEKNVFWFMETLENLFVFVCHRSVRIRREDICNSNGNEEKKQLFFFLYLSDIILDGCERNRK